MAVRALSDYWQSSLTAREREDSGYQRGPCFPTESSHRIIDRPRPIPSSAAAARRGLNRLTSVRSSIGSTAAPVSPRLLRDRTAVIARGVYDELIRDLRRSLTHSNATVDQWFMLHTLLGTTMVLRNQLLCRFPEQSAQNMHIRNPRPPPPVFFGPERRPLSTAAIIQNVRAHTRKAYEKVLAAYGYDEVTIHSDYPARYGHAYDDMLGTFVDENGADAAVDARSRMFNRTTYFGRGFGKGHAYKAIEDRHLIEMRQARALGRLGTEDLDREIERRVSHNPSH